MAKDFIRLEKLFKKHVEKDNKNNVKLNKAYPYSLEITEVSSGNYNSLVIRLNPRHWGNFRGLDKKKSSNLLDTDFYLHVNSEVSFKNEDFELKDKEKAYEHLIDLFQADILLLKDEKDK